MSLDLEATQHKSHASREPREGNQEHGRSAGRSPAAAPREPRPVLDDVLREEARFADRAYAPYADQLEISPGMFAKYAAPANLADWRQLAAVLLGDLAGRALLDYGCGMGEEAVYFAKLGARVTAIDISEVGVATLRRRAAHHQLAIRALEMRCDPTRFAAGSFDRIHGMGILHHIGIDTALAEVWRLLRPGGVGVFLEPMGDHAPIEAAKRFLMTHARFLGELDEVTGHEHNLTWREIEHATRRFARAAAYPYHLLYRLKRFIPGALHDTVRRFDHGALAIAPRLRRYAGAVVIHVVR
jgi:cyclopropane fatty-acyl-phospholipid synthase-like methyltransferase